MGEPVLLLQAEKTLARQLRANLVSCCPTMDLVAVVTQDEQLEVYRFNGQKAFGLHRRNPDTTVQSICWKFNGQYIAVGWRDGTVDVVSAESGKVLQHFKHVTAAAVSNPTPEPTLCIGWSLNLIKVKAVSDRVNIDDLLSSNGKPGRKDLIESLRDYVSLDDFLDRQPDHETLSIHPNLPEELALLDVESVLPKLPIVPLLTATGLSTINPEIFASQPALDLLLQKHTRDHNSVETLIVHNANRTGTIIVYDSLNVGSFRYPERWASLEIAPLLHVSHPFSYTHMILVETKVIPSSRLSYGTRTPRKSTRRTHVPEETDTAGQQTRLALIPLTLRFIKSSGIILHIIASKTAQLQNILQYILRCVESVTYLWNTSHEFPSKSMANIEETLAEEENGTLVQNLYHLAMSGDCPLPVKEWLADQVAERGHKRWDHSVSNGYQRILDLTHENLLPALDRCTMLISALRGLALHYQESQILDVPIPQFRVIIERVRCLRFLSHQILIIASEERRQFLAFSRWMRHEIEVQATEPTSAAADEVLDRDIGIDYAQLLAYIRGPLKASRMPKFMEDVELSAVDDLDHLSYETLQKQLKQHNNGMGTKFPCLSLWIHLKELQSSCLSLVKKITFSQVAGTDVACGIFLDDGEVSSLDMKMVHPGPKDVSSMFSYIAYVPKTKPDEVRLHRLYHESFIDDSRSIKSAKSFTIAFEGFDCLDVKFADETHLLVLIGNGSSSFILSFDLRPTDDSHEVERNFKDWRISETKPSLMDFELPNGQPRTVAPAIRLSLEQTERFIKHKFNENERFRPLKMEVNGRKNRRVLCVVGEDLRQYRILDLDFLASQMATEEAQDEPDVHDDE
ncbi:hypothetical protein P152DRAFT_515037 [Eremomyces bilateralis CBS 781.70]|uniref:Anaphase-promoting complex subunit 4 n=1 Tax=Eremomyces bilateralis CBS 781.70 TaxID=1392243 RepID=A0A6G1G0B4_9PEZI|nr:uncharacterized protein P152DRAFT_515037 [Eremomyces bilateralis CBS 781.70]KAF1811483.1 hypothetical protein P152DRAFT_515037 [Eremomyces bilateralis CBS 781.70]